MSFQDGYTRAPFAQTQEDIQQRANRTQFMEQGRDAFPATQQGEPQLHQISQATQHAEPSLHQPLPYQQQVFPNQQTEEISQVRDFKNQFPLARAKKIMKADEDVKMIAADAPAVFAKAGGPFAQTEDDIQRQAYRIQLMEQRSGAIPATQQGEPQIHHIFQAMQHAEPSLHQPLPSQQQAFPNQQTLEISQVTLDFENQFPLSRIKKIMKADEDVKMIAADAPAVLGKACELFIKDLLGQSWIHTQEKQRRTLQKNDIADAIIRTDWFDFLTDIVPKR